MKPFVLLVCLLWLSSNYAFSQFNCGFDKVHEQRMATDPAYRTAVNNTEQSIRAYIRKNESWLRTPRPRRAMALYTIPVVVHVVHTGGAVGSIYNPTDAQIIGAIDYLNQVYNGTYPGTGGAGDLEIQFVLAQRDPNCNPTNGINRVDGSGVTGYVSGGVNVSLSSGADELDVKNLIRWNTSQYYNIWVVNKIDGADGTSGSFTAGFAYFPGAPSSLDGTIMLATQMKTGAKTLPHEIGHAFSLYHPFQGAAGSTCPVNTDCSLNGDQICDTDPITQPAAFACRTGTNACTGTPYTDNTESNYMNYTNCYTLFTADQKIRMLAAAGTHPSRTSLASSLGGTAPNAGGSPCPPKINFEFTDDQVTEASSGTSGCQSYTDYTFNMVIGNTPSATATATLNVSAGTATEGVDFDVTTNGNFASPSKTLTFVSGSMASQPFTIRVYDDASVEATETFTLDFTVNNGGGDAQAGDGRPEFTLTIHDNDVAPIAVAGMASVTLGTGAGISGFAPFQATLASQKADILYTAAELNAAGLTAGNLTGIALYLQKNSTRAFTNYNIKIGTTALPYLINGSANVVTTNVVKTLASYNTVDGWNDFTFDTPFAWDGTSNLVFEFCYDNGTADAGDAADNVVLFLGTGGAGQRNMYWNNNRTCAQSFSGFSYFASGDYKPVAGFSYEVPPTDVQTNLNTSKQEYLGANADIYFYDQADGKLLARIRNLSSHDYGCTQVTIDRAGTASTQFWNTNTSNYLMNKTFHVIPANNNPSGQYEITLYYSQAEVQGWEAATGQTWTNIQLVKVANQIADVTPASPTGAGAYEVVVPTRGTLGTNYTLTYTFASGFSGFGAGVVGSPLPVTLLSFNGKLQNGHALLKWETANEVNSKEFEMERSLDGVDFIQIGRVAAAGYSSSPLSYSFTDPEAAPEVSYYRLRMVDLDGQFVHSNTIMIRNQNAIQNIRVMNNPFNDYIDIRFDKIPGGRLRIHLNDLNGRQLQLAEYENMNQLQLRFMTGTKPLSAGVYLLEVIADDRRYTFKVIKR